MRPPLKPYEVGALELELRCAMDGCKRGARASEAGFALPFCILHLDLLSRAKFELLCEFAESSPYDPGAVALAQAHLDRCLRFLRTKRERL